MSANLDNSAVATGLEKFSFHPNPKEGQCQKMFKLPPNCIHSHARLRQYVNQELPDVQAGLRKGRGTRDQIANIHWITEKANGTPLPPKRNTSTSASLTILKSSLWQSTVWITTNCGKFLKRWEYQTSLPVPWKTWMQVKKQQLEPDMEQQTGSKLGKE